MRDSQMSFRIDSDTKRKAMEIYDSLGIGLTTAINVFLLKSIEENGFPFEVKRNPHKINLEERIDNVEKGKNLSKRFSSVEELFEDLNA